MSGSRRWLWLALGVLAVLPLLAVDLSVVALLLDPELLAAVGGAGLLLVRSDLRDAVRRGLATLPVLWVRAGAALTWHRPATLLSI
jgi:hypothetical protein